MFGDVEIKIKKKNKIFFNRESSSLVELRALIMQQSHLTLVLWVFDNLNNIIEILSEKYPEEEVFKIALETCVQWAHGIIKMSDAKKAILNCHSFAKNLENPLDIAYCHALGQGLSTVHVETHAIGMVFYELTAIVIKNGYSDYEIEVSNKINNYISKLKFWSENEKRYRESQNWAKFLIKEGKTNKEKLLFERENTIKKR